MNTPPTVGEILEEHFAPATEIMVFGEGDRATVVEVDVATGEIVTLPELPAGVTGNAQSIADYIGPRLVDARAELAGLEAKRAEWLAAVAKGYDARIKRQKQYIDWLTGQPGIKGPLEDLARSLGYDHPNAKRRSGAYGLLKIGFKLSQGGRTLTKVLDESAAIRFLKQCCPDAVRAKETVLVSGIPADLPIGEAAATGLERVEPTAQFYIE